jgi:hypothetical protein
LQIPEADLEYLIRTLSDARSRATELAVSIGSRLGSEHQLTALANVAASNIETTLREVRQAANQKPTNAKPDSAKPDSAKPDSAHGLADLHGALQTGTTPVAPSRETYTPSTVMTSFASAASLDAEHWLSAFVDELLALARASGGVTFERAERLLQQRKDEFLRDFLIARRMYRTYPKLFPEISDETRQASTP